MNGPVTRLERYSRIKAQLDVAHAALVQLRALDDKNDETLDPIVGPAIGSVLSVVRDARARMRAELVRLVASGRTTTTKED
jgi:hypothetical protein